MYGLTKTHCQTQTVTPLQREKKQNHTITQELLYTSLGSIPFRVYDPVWADDVVYRMGTKRKRINNKSSRSL